MERLTGDVDVLIVGAGLSGIAAGYYLQARIPQATYLILEARAAMGGTWDLFRYPGVRSDSDMHTLGYSFRPWQGDIALADGPSIAAYIRETAHEFGIDRHIRFHHRAVRASWSPAEGRWTVEVRTSETSARKMVRCRFLFMCSGYYEYASGYVPEFKAMQRYRGIIVHPQAWPENLDYRDKRVIVIGSGATAITIVPKIAQDAAHVTMVQRSPSYVVSLPLHDPLAGKLHRFLPEHLGHAIVRWRNVLRQQFYYNSMQRYPQAAKARIKRLTRKMLGPSYDVDRHFTPHYNPWDQRLCFIPDGDLFAALREGRASIVTGEIETFTESGLRMQDGEVLDADVIVTATGFEMRLLGGVQLIVDGNEVDPAKSIVYKGMMLCGVPNAALAVGYTNASWTLKCELTARYVCRLLAYMDRHGYAYCAPRAPNASARIESSISLKSGYVKRAEPYLPKQAARSPWRLHQNYALDLASLRFGRVRDGVMEFVRL